MATLCLIIAESGKGKSTSIRTLDAKETFIINVLNKPLPFKGWQKNYTEIKDGKGNYFQTDDPSKILSTLDYISNKRPDVRQIVIDDFHYVMANMFMRQHSNCSKGNAVFQLYNDIADSAWKIIYCGAQLARKDLIVFFLSHSQTDDLGNTKVKTIGKLLDDKITVEGLFTIVLQANVSEGKYYFITQNTGFNTCKSPIGMFDSKEIDNDLNFVATKIREYNS